MDSRTWLKPATKAPPFLSYWLVYHYNMPQAHGYSTGQKKQKPLANHRTTVGCFFRTSFCTVQQRHVTLRVYLRVHSYFYQSTDRGKSNPTLRIYMTCIWKMKGSRAGRHHHPGCFPLDTFQLVNVQKTWLPNDLICTEDSLPVLIPPWLFRVKLFSLNVKHVQNIKNEMVR